ncbi:glycosyltransferase [Chroococcidiopsis sp.]|uniref:glycosyltransferase n=1 Tax=Chroococcidiopsis sp. TaxID=3088168 RepID=UPI003F3328A6
MLKVAFIVNHFPLLSETFILNQITGLLERGHQVDIYTCTPGDLNKVHPDVEKYCLLERTYYLPEIPQNFLRRSLKAIGLLSINFTKAPAKLLRSLNGFKYGKSATSLRLFYAAIAGADKRAYDIVHCQFGTLSFWGMLFRTINAPQAKLIVSFRGYDISQFIQEHGDRIYDRTFIEADLFLPNCDFFKRRLLKLGCDEKKICVHYSGIDCDRFQYTPRYRHSNQKICIATIGRLVEKKGIEYSIRAIAKIVKFCPNLEYKIVGCGALQTELEQLIQELDLTNIVHLLGKKDRQEIIEVLQASHIFIAPSITARDGNQDAPVNVLKEAMAIGLPVISTYHGGIPELVEDGVSGFLVPERDAEAIASKLQYLIANPEIWNIIGAAGRERVEKYFNMQNLNDELVYIYQKVSSEE